MFIADFSWYQIDLLIDPIAGLFAENRESGSKKWLLDRKNFLLADSA